jgi:hypothetical protein
MYSYPLIRGGGLFLLIVGAMLAAGAFLPRARNLLLASGLALASIATAIAAPGLARPLGVPTRQQILALAGSVLLEMILIPVIVRRVQHRGERTIILSVLFAVGLHFLPMSVAFGPIIGFLGIVTILNASAGLWLWPTRDLSIFWFVDGLLKMVCGITMLLAVLV